jgi:hypothetical protein
MGNPINPDRDTRQRYPRKLTLMPKKRPGRTPSRAPSGGLGYPSAARSTRILSFGSRRENHFTMLTDSNLKRYFSPDVVWDVASFSSQSEYERMITLLRSTNPNGVIGSYMSAVSAITGAADRLPPTKIPAESCDESWFLHTSGGDRILWGSTVNRWYLDPTNATARTAVISLAISRALADELDAVSFDNCYWGTGNPTGSLLTDAQWTTAFMIYYAEMGVACHAAGLKVFCNVATQATSIPTAFAAIAPSIDGLMSEMAFHPATKSLGLIPAEIAGYADVLEQDKIVMLFTRYPEDENYGLTQIRNSLVPLYQGIYCMATGAVHANPLYDY